MTQSKPLFVGQDFDVQLVSPEGPGLYRFFADVMLAGGHMPLMAELVGRLDISKERVDPEIDSPTWVELHRSPYRFAAAYCEDKEVLDVGCSHGYGTAVLAQRAGYAVGFDLYPEVVADAERRFGHERLRFLAHDANEPFPFADESFDVVFSSEVIEHVREQDRCAAEMARVLRPGGLLILKTPDVRSARRGNVFHYREFSRGELEQMLRRHFDMVKVCFFALKTRWVCNKVDLPERPSPRSFGEPVPVGSAMLLQAALRPSLLKDTETADLLAVAQKAPVTPDAGPFTEEALSAAAAPPSEPTAA